MRNTLLGLVALATTLITTTATTHAQRKVVVVKRVAATTFRHGPRVIVRWAPKASRTPVRTTPPRRRGATFRHR